MSRGGCETEKAGLLSKEFRKPHKRRKTKGKKEENTISMACVRRFGHSDLY